MRMVDESCLCLMMNRNNSHKRFAISEIIANRVINCLNDYELSVMIGFGRTITVANERSESCAVFIHRFTSSYLRVVILAAGSLQSSKVKLYARRVVVLMAGSEGWGLSELSSLPCWRLSEDFKFSTQGQPGEPLSGFSSCGGAPKHELNAVDVWWWWFNHHSMICEITSAKIG